MSQLSSPSAPVLARLARLALTGLGPLLVAAAVGAGCEGEGEGTKPGGSITSGPNTAPQAPLAAPHACGATISEVAVFQAVKILLVVDGKPVSTVNAPLIEGRRALFRAYVKFTGTPVQGRARARLRLESSTGQWNVDGEGFLGRDSREDSLESSFNFDVPGELMRGDLRMAVELELGATCPDAGRTSYPVGGLLALGLINTGKLKLHLLPVAYDADKSGRLPDTTDDQLERYRQVLLATYPVSEVEITIRNPVRTSILLTGGSGWGMFLDSIRAQRNGDRVGNDVHYYALVAPANSFSDYCSRACIAGLSYLASSPSGERQVGAGVGFTGAVAGETLVHEVGHQHGRGHAPCEATDGLDGRFPYKNAMIGVWGLDFRDMGMKSPQIAHDVMSYCEPWWVSDYTYAALADRRQAIALNAGARVVNVGKSALPTFRGFRSLLTGVEGKTVWGNALPPDLVPDGTPELAQALDASGKVVAEVTVYRNTLGHAAGSVASYDVPTPRDGWVSLQIAGQPAIRFADPIGVPALRPFHAKLDGL